MRRYLLLCAFGLGTTGLGTTYAQEAQAPTASADSIEEVTVTGTRIVRPEFASPAPLTSLSSQQLLEANPGGPVDALRQLPVLAFSNGPRGSTGSSGQGGSFLNLRNLGANRTLVLLDGQRFVPTSSMGSVDISLLPMALVERTEIVTGGASAAYGSDAVTGVVNFILDRNFTGFKASAQGGVSTFGDDKESEFSMTFGTAFADNRGHLLLSGERYKSAGVYSLLDRPMGQNSCAPITNPGGATARTFACDVRSSQANFTGIVSAPSPLKYTTFDDAGNPIPFHTGSLVSSTTMVGGDGIRPQFVPMAVPIDRNVVFARLSWQFTDKVTGYLEANYGKSNYDYQIGSFDQNLGSTALSIAYDNAYLPASLSTALQALKDPKTGKIPTLTLNKYFADLPRTWIQNDNDTTRVVGGLEGKVADWSWDFHYEHGENRQRLSALMDENLNHMTLAADAVLNPATGQIVCRSSLTNPGNGCLPFNVFGNAGQAAPSDGTGFNSVTEAQLNYLTGTDWSHALVKQDNAAVNFNGEPFSIWAGPVSLATGLEWRKESIAQTVSQSGLVTNTASGVPGPFRVGNYQAQSGSLSVREGYVETVAPLARNLPLIKNLDFNGAVRLTNYSTSGNAVTWKTGLSWSIIDDVRIRATRSRDERAPNLNELYSGAVAGHNSIIDYVQGPTVVNSQALVYTRGNPNLNPEKGDTTTVGIVYQPHWGPDWQTSVDWYHIALSDAIVAVPAQQLVQQCSLGNTADCGYIIRDSTGALFGVNQIPQNVQSVVTTGVDVETRYRFPLANLIPVFGGDITLHGIFNYVSTFETATLGVATVNQAGQLTHPTTRITAQLNYDIKPWSFFIQARYSGWGYYDKTTLASDLPQHKIGGQTPIDINIAYDLPLERGETSIYLNVTDVFNLLPPPWYDGPGSSGQNYDPLGRFYRLGIRVRL